MVALVVLSCAACGSTAPTVLVHDVRGRGDDALITGSVGYLADADCFVIESAGVRHVAVWPPDTEAWVTGTEVAGVRVPDREPIAIGSQLTAGGGYTNPTASGDLDLPEVPAECFGGGGEFALIHVITAVTPG
ncbi:hypothetical protein [Asanoa siamensis]|uniref:hypothetical protein n=1 Tax=Asanoa siamensis TaxID=926357 RepID=UPI0019439ED1|nr:hypothetical protein [Asanoa siamensis]